MGITLRLLQPVQALPFTAYAYREWKAEMPRQQPALPATLLYELLLSCTVSIRRLILGHMSTICGQKYVQFNINL